jgi:hypothetical protein
MNTPSTAPDEIRATSPSPFDRGIKARVRAFTQRYHKVLWWLHSAYALVLGSCVVLFAQKGFEHARVLSVSIGAAWLLILALFRIFGTTAKPTPVDPSAKKPQIDLHAVKFFAVTYLLKNLYQGMLFFLLPFYWKAATIGTLNSGFVVALGIFAILSTLDIVFDKVLMKFRVLGALFHGFTLFACLNLVVPALIPETPTLVALLVSAGIAVLSFFSLHASLASLKNPKMIALMVVVLGATLGGTYAARAAIPPVPMYLAHASVGPEVLPGGKLAMEVTSLDASVITHLIAVTDIALPGGKSDRLVHVWRRNGEAVHRSDESTARVPGPDRSVRLRSTLDGKHLPAELDGDWSVDVETEGGQLVGRTTFKVTK